MRNNMTITARQEQARLALVPKLRFPEFRGTDGWENAILGDLSVVVRGGSPRPIDGFLTPAADGLNWLKIGDVDKEAKYVTHTEEKVRPEALSMTRVVNSGDLILSNSMSFGRPYILQIKTCIHDGWIAITDIAKNADRDFLYYLISAPSSQSYFVDNAAGSGVQNLNADIIKALPICFPLPAEQQKIADCLSSVDELIAAQARKVDALKTYKKGLMQQLFPREGETQPRLRFPEFQNAGEWDDAPMGTLLMSSPDYGVNAAAVPLSGHLPKYLRITDISTDGRYLPETQVSVNLEATDGNYLDEGDIVLARTGASVGKSYQYRKEDGRLVFAGFLIRVKPDPKKLVSSYLANFLVTAKFWKWVAVNSARSGQPGINSTEYSSLTIPLPPTLREQHRIATCLSSLDTLITAETQKHEALKTHKKALMQQLFPSPDETLP